MLHTHEEADEAAQVAFVRAWQSRASFRGASSIRTWLIRIALNVSKSMRAKGMAVDARIDSDTLVDASPGSDERIHREQRRQQVRAAVSGLPPRRS